MSLPESAKGTLGRLAAGVIALSSEERIKENELARQVLTGLRASVGTLPDSDLAAFAYMVGCILATLTALPVSELASTLENGVGAYGLAAAHLAGLYDLNTDPVTDKPEESPYILGGYL